MSAQPLHFSTLTTRLYALNTIFTHPKPCWPVVHEVLSLVLGPCTCWSPRSTCTGGSPVRWWTFMLDELLSIPEPEWPVAIKGAGEGAAGGGHIFITSSTAWLPKFTNCTYFRNLIIVNTTKVCLRIWSHVKGLNIHIHIINRIRMGNFLYSTKFPKHYLSTS